MGRFCQHNCLKTIKITFTNCQRCRINFKINAKFRVEFSVKIELWGHSWSDPNHKMISSFGFAVNDVPFGAGAAVAQEAEQAIHYLEYWWFNPRLGLQFPVCILEYSWDKILSCSPMRSSEYESV